MGLKGRHPSVVADSRAAGRRDAQEAARASEAGGTPAENERKQRGASP